MNRHNLIPVYNQIAHDWMVMFGQDNVSRGDKQ